MHTASQFYYVIGPSCNRFTGYGVLTLKIAISHRLAMSPLQQCTHYRAKLLSLLLLCLLWINHIHAFIYGHDHRL